MNDSIYPCLWFDGQAQAAATYYCGVFKNARIISDNGLVVVFELNGNKFMGLNGGNHFKFNEAISFVISCTDQSEIDYYWAKLTSDGGQESMCGWVKDKFGVSWQIVPKNLSLIMGSASNSQNVMAALLQMKKIDIQILEDAGRQ